MLRSPMPLVALLVVVSTGCPSYTQIAEPERAEIDGVRAGELLWLRQSLYYGQFYDDDRFTLVYPRRFEEISYLRTVEGDVISPPPATGIIPVGTRVRVEKIEWPTGEAVFRRPLYTPRYATWVILRVARDRGDTYLERDTRHILLLPGGIPDRETFDTWFGAFFSEEDPNAWLLRMPEAVRAGVFEKRPVVGMDYDTLTAAMGYPDRLTREGGDTGTTEVAIFGPVSVVLEEGVVVRVSDPLAETPGARPAPDAPTADAPEIAPVDPSSSEGAAAPEPAVGAPTTSEPPVEESPSEAPVDEGVGEPSTGEPSTGEPSTDQPSTDQPSEGNLESLVDGVTPE